MLPPLAHSSMGSDPELREPCEDITEEEEEEGDVKRHEGEVVVVMLLLRKQEETADPRAPKTRSAQGPSSGLR